MAQDDAFERSDHKIDFGVDAIKKLKVIANFIFICGIITSVIIFFTMGIKDRGSSMVDSAYEASGIVLAFEVLISSIVTKAFLIVICHIANNIIVIRKSLEK